MACRGCITRIKDPSWRRGTSEKMKPATGDRVRLDPEDAFEPSSNRMCPKAPSKPARATSSSSTATERRSHPRARLVSPQLGRPLYPEVVQPNGPTRPPRDCGSHSTESAIHVVGVVASCPPACRPSRRRRQIALPFGSLAVWHKLAQILRVSKPHGEL